MPAKGNTARSGYNPDRRRRFHHGGTKTPVVITRKHKTAAEQEKSPEQAGTRQDAAPVEVGRHVRPPALAEARPAEGEERLKHGNASRVEVRRVGRGRLPLLSFRHLSPEVH